ncbi:hypothetical protein L1987_37008 [Smallanthus sonchifolius]|uniref:Uncharacterized protein n=1 Tax=Smallanthus sonchifolius TaxID=185202 RepID=A0ACB9HF50_9ASTR|nr:hypothetical protein L1987_37008 [Smallanthus sonchifolius]
MAVMVVLLVLLLTKPGFSQSNDHDNNTNLIAMRCGRGTLISLPNFIKNRNSTFNELRMQLLSKGVLYAKAQALSAGDSVFAVVQCRNYLSVDQCVACFDDSVSKLFNCTSGNGAFISFDNCYVRYEDYADFYNDPYVMEDANGIPTLLCGNQSASQPTVFNQVVDEFLSDIRDATLKTSNLYVASTRQIASENATVYVIGQCVEGHSSKVPIIAAAVGGVILMCLILLSWLLYRSWKKSKKTEQDFEGAVHYDYKDLQLATNNFSEENILGKGGFGEVFKSLKTLMWWQGYTAPEYALHGVLSEKVDTYSFGIVILEIISGRRSTEVKSHSDYLLENVRFHINTLC